MTRYRISGYDPAIPGLINFYQHTLKDAAHLAMDLMRRGWSDVRIVDRANVICDHGSVNA